MGISGLLPMLKDATVRVHLSKYKDKVLGVDAYVWLHRGAYGCAEALAMGRFTDAYVRFAMGKINMLKHHGVIPYLVFDGDRLPAKACTEHDRRKRREESRAQARQLIAQGKRSAAREHFVKSIDVTPAMAFQLIKALRQAKIDYIVAPYEADAQLAYLERRGTIDGIITEDSDLLVFGCKSVLFKLDDNGYCDEVLHARRGKCSSAGLHAFSDDMFRQMAILSGCDYLPSIPKMGLKTANELLRKYSTVPKSLAVMASKGSQIPEGYRAAFERAEKTFVYQRVFDKKDNGEVRITTLTTASRANGEVEVDDCVGPYMSDEVARGIAYGDLDPISRKPIEDLAKKDEAEKSDVSAKSFYAQTRPKWMMSQRRKKGSTSTQALPGQKKLEGFFTAKENTQSLSRSSEKHAAHRDVSRVRLETTSKFDGAARATGDVFDEQPPTGKSRFFARPKQQQEDEKMMQSSPEKVYEGSAALAKFSSPSQKCKRKRSDSAQSSEAGLISSPVSSILVEKSTNVLDSPASVSAAAAAQEEFNVPSSPCASPTFIMHKMDAKARARVVPTLRSPSSNDVPSVSGCFDQFRFEHDTAATTAGMAKTPSLQTPVASIQKTIAQTRMHAGSLRTTSASSSSKRALAVRYENDPLDHEDDDIDVDAALDYNIGGRLHSLLDTPTVAGHRKPLFTPSISTPSEAIGKRSNSFRRLKMDV